MVIDLRDLRHIAKHLPPGDAGIVEKATDEIERLRRVDGAARALALYCQRSVNAGPITKGPHKEAALWRDLHAALAGGEPAYLEAK